jgi:hypothetical protein
MAAGYIYVLANSAMPGLVKIGKTTRLPSARAEELSGVTGVATPFIIVYEEFFDDCDSVEAFVHHKLSDGGLRISENREFFRAPVSDVIKVILSARSGSMNRSNSSVPSADDLISGDDDSLSEFRLQGYVPPQPWDDLMEEAERHYYGHDGYLQDYAEAFELFRDAARLGSPRAYRRLGDMYRIGEGVRADAEKALEFYKEGVRKKNHLCYANMTRLFLGNDSVENAQKAFAKFIEQGELGGWSHEEYKGEHLEEMIWTISLALVRARSVSVDRFIELARPYMAQILEWIDRILIDPKVGVQVKEKFERVAQALRNSAPPVRLSTMVVADCHESVGAHVCSSGVRGGVSRTPFALQRLKSPVLSEVAPLA